MKKLLIPFLVIAFAVALHAATLNLSLTISAREAKALTFATAIENQSRTNRVPPLPALSSSEFAELKLRDVISYYVDRATQADRESLAKRYESATQAKRDQVDQIIP